MASYSASDLTIIRTYSLFSSSSQTSAINLDRTNYLVWESFVLLLIEGNRLEYHINGLDRVPPRLILEVVSNITRSKSNLEYEEWYLVDRMLVGWLRNTMTQDVGAQLLHCRTAEDLWNAAKSLTCASMKARIMIHKTELHSTRKNNMKMEEYLEKMKTVSDQLALAEAPISIEDLILYTLNSLEADYNSIVTY